MGGGLRVIVLNPKFKFVWFYEGFFGFGIGIPISIFCLTFWRTQIWNLVIQNEDCKVLSEQVCIEVPKQICRSQPQKSCCPSNKQQCIKETSALVAWFWWWLGFSFIDPPSQPCLGDSIVTFPFQNGTEKGPTGYFFSHTNLGLKQLGRFYRLKTPPFPSEIGTFKFENKLMTKIKKYYFKSISTVNALENHF